MSHPVAEEEFQEHGKRRSLSGAALTVVVALCLLFSVYQLVVAAFHPLSSLVTRSLHVGFLMAIAYLLYPMSRRSDAQRIAWYDWLFALVSLGLGAYQWVFEGDLIQRAGDPSSADLVVGSLLVVLLFEICRRLLGMALPVICGCFVLYALFGHYLPGELGHRPFDFDQVVSQLATGTEGIFGIPTLVSATYIFLFILFGAFLEHAGMIDLFNNIALGLVGRAKGGPAKVAVISSGFMGMISGSGVANVLTVGQFTIPLMKRFGYSSVFAGAVEATASMGGQIMPPVMGAVAFIMAETLNVPYIEIVKAAIIPAVLYYVTAFWIVHLEAMRKGLTGLTKEETPDAWKALKENWHLLVPLAALVGMLFHGFTPMFAGMTGLALTAILILGAAIAAKMSAVAFRYVFWLALALGASTFLKWGIYPVLGIIGALCLACLFIGGGRATLATLRDSLVDGAMQALPVGLACAIVGTIIGSLTLTGAATTFAGFVMTVGESSLIGSLLLTMIVCLILGMGIPTIPNYIITSSIAAPALLKLGVPLIVSHMFTFYFGIMADLTPPVALAALAASSIAKASQMDIGWKATQIAIAGFVIPFMAVYEPALMLQGDWTIAAVTYIVFKALLAIGMWGIASVGHFWIALKLWERLFLAVGALMLVTALPVTDELGFAMAIAFFVWHGWQKRKLAAA